MSAPGRSFPLSWTLSACAFKKLALWLLWNMNKVLPRDPEAAVGCLPVPISGRHRKAWGEWWAIIADDTGSQYWCAHFWKPISDFVSKYLWNLQIFTDFKDLRCMNYTISRNLLNNDTDIMKIGVKIRILWMSEAYILCKKVNVNCVNTGTPW